MADVKCPVGNLVMAGVPAAAAEMTMSIRWTGSCAPSSDGYKTMEAQRRGGCVHERPEGLPEGCLGSSSEPQAGLQGQV